MFKIISWINLSSSGFIRSQSLRINKELNIKVTEMQNRIKINKVLSRFIPCLSCLVNPVCCHRSNRLDRWSRTDSDIRPSNERLKKNIFIIKIHFYLPFWHSCTAIVTLSFGDFNNVNKEAVRGQIYKGMGAGLGEGTPVRLS